MEKKKDYYPCGYTSKSTCSAFYPDNTNKCDFSNICKDNPKYAKYNKKNGGVPVEE
jgi:hypothetical protein